ncbi:MAG: ABC transporter substrate-binding protein [Candidatus Acetothermia bacterium]
MLACKKLALVLVVGILLFGFSFGGLTAEEPVKIGISQIVEHPALDAVRDAVIEVVKENGFEEGKDVEFLTRNAQGDFNNALSIAQTFKSENVDVVVPIATPTAQAAAEVFDETPLVVSAVTNFVEAGLVDSYDDYENPEDNGNITGVTDMTPVRKQIELITDLRPEIEKIGIVYNPGEANSRYLNSVAEDVAEDLGIEVVKASANKSSEVQMAADSLKGRAGAIWVSNDNTVVSALPAVSDVAVDEDIPLVTADPTTIADGPVAAFGWSYQRHGEVCGEVVVRILGGEEPNEIPIHELEQTKENIKLALNLDVAREIELEFPESALELANQVYYAEKLWEQVG